MFSAVSGSLSFNDCHSVLFDQFEYENRNRTAQPPQQQRRPAPAPPAPIHHILPTQRDRRQPLPTSPPPIHEESEDEQPFFGHVPTHAPAPQRPTRDSTPDPFDVDHSPSEHDAGAFLLQHAPDPYASAPRMPLSQRVPDTRYHVESDEEDGEESQMFPGSDLF